jgi:hypothetical protein
MVPTDEEFKDTLIGKIEYKDNQDNEDSPDNLRKQVSFQGKPF